MSTHSDDTRQRALTICQPYAHLIVVIGEKPIENRRWNTTYRGTLLIHAGKSRAFLMDGDEQRYPDIAFGAIIGSCTLVDCVKLASLPKHLQGHQHAEGPWCWLLEDIRALGPIPCSGAQGLWKPNAAVMAGLAADYLRHLEALSARPALPFEEAHP